MIISLEMVIFALLFLYIYRTKEYFFKHGAAAVPLGHGGYQGGFLGIRAYGQALNIVDILGGIFSVPRALAERNASGQGARKVWSTGAQVSELHTRVVYAMETNDRRGDSMRMLR